MEDMLDAARSNDSKVLKGRGTRYLSEVLYSKLERAKHFSGHPNPLPENVFFCRSELEAVWDAESVAIIFFKLSEAQRAIVRDDLLLFISFLVLVDVSSKWLASCEAHLFREDRKTLKFTDKDEPRTKDELVALGVSPAAAGRWKDQYMFRPVTIKLSPEEWKIQKVTSPCPLPFQIPEDVGPTPPIPGGYGDSTAKILEIGTVRLYQISPEYAQRGTDGTAWRPERPPLVVVKSFSAGQKVIDEVKNMEFLKQSLTREDARIAIHDAIIEERQGDLAVYSIISPYATRGDLAHFLRDGMSADIFSPSKAYEMQEMFPSVTSNQEGLRWSLFLQCSQLAEALKFLHEGFLTQDANFRVFCAHMDLKPENILIFESPQWQVGRWKLCDFGISVLQAQPLRGQQGQAIKSVGDLHWKAMGKTIQTVMRLVPSTYHAPEIEHPSMIHRVNHESGGRSMDIWSLGTILTEVLAYASGGASSVREFRQVRTQYASNYTNDYFYDSEASPDQHIGGGLPCSLRREVSDWLDRFDDDCDVSAADQPCFKCWAQFARRILEVDPAQRPKAKVIVDDWIPRIQDHSARPGEHPRFDDQPSRGEQREPSHPTEHQTGTRSSSVSAPLVSEPVTTTTTNDTSLDSETGISSSLSSQDPTSTVTLTRQSNTVLLDLDSSSSPIDHDIDDRKLVYLTQRDIEIFQFDVSKDVSRPVNQARVSLEGHIQWRGLIVQGSEAVVWGVARDRPIIRVYNVSTGVPVIEGRRLLYEITDASEYFDYSKRAVISKNGHLAVFKGNVATVFDTRGQTRPSRSYTLRKEGPVTKFLDLAFNDSGSMLFAWSVRDLDGLLVVYDLAKESSDPMCHRKFKNLYSAQAPQVRIMPLHDQLDCLVFAGQRLFFGCIDESRRNHVLHGHPVEEGYTPQVTAEPPRGWDLIAACVSSNTFVTLQGSGLRPLRTRKGKLFKLALGPTETNAFRPQSELADVKELAGKDEVNCSVKISAIRYGDGGEHCAVLVAHRKRSKVEILT